MLAFKVFAPTLKLGDFLSITPLLFFRDAPVVVLHLALMLGPVFLEAPLIERGEFLEIICGHTRENEASILQCIGERLSPIGELIREADFAISAAQVTRRRPALVALFDLAILIADRGFDAPVFQRRCVRSHMLLGRAIERIGPFIIAALQGYLTLFLKGQVTDREALRFQFETRALQVMRAELRPALFPLFEFCIAIPVADFVSETFGRNLALCEKHVDVEISRIVIRVWPMDRDVDDHPLLRHFARKVMNQSPALIDVEFIGQSDLEVPRQLRLIRSGAFVFPTLDGVPQLLAVQGPVGGVLGGENLLPFRLTEVPVILDLVCTLISELLASDIGGARNRALSLPARNNAGFKAIECRKLPS